MFIILIKIFYKRYLVNNHILSLNTKGSIQLYCLSGNLLAIIYVTQYIMFEWQGYMPIDGDESTSSPKDGLVDMEEVMGWLLRSQTSTPTFDCSGNSNSTVTSCAPLTTQSTILSCDCTNLHSYDVEQQQGVNNKFNIQCCASNTIFEDPLRSDMTTYIVQADD